MIVSLPVLADNILLLLCDFTHPFCASTMALPTAERRVGGYECPALRGLIGLVARGLALWPLAGQAQEPYPSRTVKIVVPAAPGSTTDTLARIVADQLRQKWGKATDRRECCRAAR